MISDFGRAHRAEAWLTFSSSSVRTFAFLSLSQSSFFMRMGSVMWSEYFRMMDSRSQP